MKVLFLTRPDFQKNPAGDTVQMISTGQNLKALGVDVSLSTDPNLDLSPYDIIHIFNLTRIKESYLFFLNAQKQKKKIVISPIYWPPHAYLKRPGASSSNPIAVWQHMQPMRARLIREADLLLPNAESEMEVIRRDFIHTAPYHVVPNGFPDSFIKSGPSLFREKFPNIPSEFILSVARISPRKNQEWLARICNELDLLLVLAGPVNDKSYYQKLLSYPNVMHLGVLNGDLLASAYSTSLAHALPSWFETPGLSSLEAAACGTVVISTDQGSTQEYFRDLALYVRPDNDESLIKALSLVSESSPIPLRDHIRANYPWSKIASETLKAYRSLNI